MLVLTEEDVGGVQVGLGHVSRVMVVAVFENIV